MTIAVHIDRFGPSRQMIRMRAARYHRDIPAYVIARAKSRRRKLKRKGWLWMPRSQPCTTRAPTLIWNAVWMTQHRRAVAIIRPRHLRRPLERAA
jgi:hypothetical protein